MNRLNASQIRALRLTIAAAILLVILFGGNGFLDRVHAQTSTGRFEVPWPVVLLGAITGVTYGLLAVGIVLIYRTNQIINFAQGEIGAFAAAFFGLAVGRWHIPYWFALPVALAVAGAAAAAAEVGVVRRLRNAPRLMSIVATLGVGQVLVMTAFAINSQAGLGSTYPQPAGLPEFRVGALLVSPAYTGMLLLGPAVVLALLLFLRYSHAGIGVRAVADNPELARLAGIFAGRVSMLVWVLAGCLSAFAAILTQPTVGYSGASTLGLSLLSRALAGAAIAGMTNIATALAAGMALGVLEQVLLWNYLRTGPGLVEVAMFVVIVLALLLRRQHRGRAEEKGSWATVNARRPVPEKLQQLWLVRNMGALAGVAAFAVALVLPLVITNSAAVTMSNIFALSIVGLSLGIVTGLGGQLSLGQFAVAAIGGVASYHVTEQVGNMAIAIACAGLVGGLVALFVGLPGLRGGGLLLTVTTLALALVTPSWLLQQSWMIGDGVDPRPPSPFGHPLSTGKSYYIFALAALVGVFWLAGNIRRSGFGRLLRAVRDNESNARAFTVSALRVKAQGVLLAGFVAGLGGAVFIHGLSRIVPTTFPTSSSISVVVLLVIGGAGVLPGPLYGALLVIAVPTFVPLDNAGLAATAFGQLLIVLTLPGGVGDLIDRVRGRILHLLAKRHRIDLNEPEESTEDAKPTAPLALILADRERTTDVDDGRVFLEARDLTRSFGGIQAVAAMSLDVQKGQIVGLIGPNGAGKTTTFELLSGFTRPDGGTVWFDGIDVTSLSPEARARRGLIRSFQDGALFPTLTVEETLMLALERDAPTRIAASIIGLPGAERRKRSDAAELISLMGLGRFRTKRIRELSTGTRRITEIACLIGLNPKLLLLDEPSSGVAQRETEALGDLLRRVRDYLGLTLVVIEHDMPLIMGISDRIVAMESGRIIAEGSPDSVRRDQRVLESYLGADTLAIQRSGEQFASADVRCQARTRGGRPCSRRATRNGLCVQHEALQGVRA